MSTAIWERGPFLATNISCEQLSLRLHFFVCKPKDSIDCVPYSISKLFGSKDRWVLNRLLKSWFHCNRVRLKVIPCFQVLNLIKCSKTIKFQSFEKKLDDNGWIKCAFRLYFVLKLHNTEYCDDYANCYDNSKEITLIRCNPVSRNSCK